MHSEISSLMKSKTSNYDTIGYYDFIMFSEKDKIGISLIDYQHACLAETINTLFYYTRKKSADRILLSIVVAFRHYMDIHNQTDKSMLPFTEDAYEDLYDMQYNEICRQLVKVENMFRRNMDPGGLVMILKAWWLQHMVNHREFFAPFPASEQPEFRPSFADDYAGRPYPAELAALFKSRA